MFKWMKYKWREGDLNQLWKLLVGNKNKWVDKKVQHFIVIICNKEIVLVVCTDPSVIFNGFIDFIYLTVRQ